MPEEREEMAADAEIEVEIEIEIACAFCSVACHVKPHEFETEYSFSPHVGLTPSAACLHVSQGAV